VTETARALVVATVLAGSGLGVYVLRLARIDPAEPQRLVGELRLSQWLAMILAAVGGAWVGLAVGRATQPLSGIDLTIAIGVIVLATWTLHRETRSALTILCVAFLAHAIIDSAHRPGGLTIDLAPRWFTLGCAAFNLYLSALCFWAQRRPARSLGDVSR
jgi:hypothetical protein